MTVTASPQDNYKRTRSHYFSRCFHYLVVWTVAIGRGGYFGLNMFVLLFGGFFGKLTGGVALSIQATLGILSTVGFLGIFSSKEYFNQAKFDLQKAELAQLKTKFCKLTQENTRYQAQVLTHCEKNIPPRKAAANSWQRFAKRWYFRAYNHSFEFLNSGKDFIKGMLMAATMYGLAVPIVMSSATTPVFIGFCVAATVFSIISATEYHLNKARERNQRHLKLQKFF